VRGFFLTVVTVLLSVEARHIACGFKLLLRFPDLKTRKAIYLTPDSFPVKGDGTADDSQALQQAIDRVQEKTNQGILFIPPADTG